MLVIVNELKEILYISHPVNGKCHDFNVLKKMLSPDKKYFIESNILVDLDFLGMDKQYDCKSVCFPHKKSKNKPLTREQKEENRILSSKRIVVENAICGVKVFRILSDRLRIHCLDFYDKILSCCAGLHNFRLNTTT
ncbi:transposase family protein [Thioflexithrix psekupsensis]|uniref:DDE Tnp4 domain-containing protein n=1 Tax=Thioflexithrix psekupsensis TaxID=1570016 RepID=A0A251X8J7_9GAMM|nr:transposase family protein [Thioflexithrix psekupsensis]OUD14255.1 hypothetical protein TPSD3_07980 [Thioflexithrix psekupsensis]